MPEDTRGASAAATTIAALAATDLATGALRPRAALDDDGAADAASALARVPKLPEDVHMMLSAFLNACPFCHTRSAVPTAVVVAADASGGTDEEGRPAWLVQRLQQRAAEQQRQKAEAIPEFSRLRDSRVAVAGAAVDNAHFPRVRVVSVRPRCAACTVADVNQLITNAADGAVESEEDHDVDSDRSASSSDIAASTTSDHGSENAVVAQSPEALDAALSRVSNVVFGPDGLEWIGPQVAASFARRNAFGSGAESSAEAPRPLPVVGGIVAGVRGRLGAAIGGATRRIRVDPQAWQAVLSVAWCVQELYLSDCDLETDGLLEPLLNVETTYNERLTILSLRGSVVPKPVPKSRKIDATTPYWDIKAGAIASVFPAISSVEMRSELADTPWRGEMLEGFCAALSDVLSKAQSSVGVDQPLMRQLREGARLTAPTAARTLQMTGPSVRAGVLQVLRLSVAEPGQEFFESLATHMWPLRVLDITDTSPEPTSIDDLSIVPLAMLPNLEELSLMPAPRLQGVAFATFAQCDSPLRKLSMGHRTLRTGKYGKQPVKTKAQQQANVQLPSEPEGLTDDGCARIAMLTQLEDLHVERAYQLTDKGITRLARCRTLRHVSLLGGTNASGEGFVDFETQGALERVTLTGLRHGAAPGIRTEPVWDLGVAALTEIPSLRHVALVGMAQISDTAINLLREHCALSIVA